MRPRPNRQDVGAAQRQSNVMIGRATSPAFKVADIKHAFSARVRRNAAHGEVQPAREQPMTTTAPQPVGTMRAVRIHRQGGPGGLVYEEARRPSPAQGDALVRVHAVGISPAEFTWSIWTTPDGRDRLVSF
jgi:hypothetical protein